MNNGDGNNSELRDRWKILLGVLGTLAGVLVIVLLLTILVHYAWVRPQVSGALTDQQRYDLLAKAQAEDQRLLSTYGWMDRSKGIVRLPIEVAMERMARENRPQRH